MNSLCAESARLTKLAGSIGDSRAKPGAGRALRMRSVISRDFPNRNPAEADLASTGPDPPRSLAR
jgi:hypothetical protein